ncbi:MULTISPECIES: hypothetical protein [unclassified Wolbachia]|uniref:hypothetical protein n=1 Tax=unclassified Wolbachia TaxID=2640676 RepID=UPI000A7DD993|nr:hypothetical protein [Wolbachia endosymbiont of Nomada ferruginata]
MNKNITFEALKEEHFLLLLKWLETPHVKLWWDADINWTPELIGKKYSNYIKGFKRLRGCPQTKEYVVYKERILR